MQQQLQRLLFAFLFALPLCLFSQPKIELQSYATGFTRPLDVTHCGDSRLFIVEQRGYIWILDSLGNRLPNPFLNIDPRVRSVENERGLLGLAFPPDYAETGFFYVNYTRENDGDTRVSRFSVKPDNPNEADPDSEVILLTQDQPFNNHNAGCLKFGHDGYLYIAVGDGGSGGDPQNNGQKKNSWLGKILRIDVGSSTPGLDYAVPADNPFVNDPAFLPEIWSWGWRNPWRFSFDRLTGDMWVGDVGQVTREEIDFEPAGLGGRNYGWRCYEGTFSHITTGCQPQSDYTGPVFDYDNNSIGCSITGGFIYRGSKYVDMYGFYLFTDYCSGRWWATRQLPDGSFNTSQIADLSNNQYAGLGEDRDGELYVAALGQGTIYKITEKCSAFQLTENVTNANCHGSADGAIALQTNGGAGPYTFNWSTGETGQSISNLNPGIYTVEATDSQGCIRLDSFEVGADNIQIQIPEVSVTAWTAPIPQPGLLCPGADTVWLEAAVAPQGFGYQWFRNGEELIGATNQQLAVQTTGNYHVQYTNTPCNSAPSTPTEISSDINLPVPVIETSSSVLCPGDEALLEVTGALPEFNLQWYRNNEPILGATTSTLTVTEGGVYTIGLEYAGCALPVTALVDIIAEVHSMTPYIDQNNDTLTLAGGAVWVSYQWSLNGEPIPGANEVFYVATENGFYECLGISELGCEAKPGLQAIVVSTVLPESVTRFSLTPNPTNGAVKLTLNLQRPERVNLLLHDAQQRQLFTKLVQGQRIAEEIDLSQLPAGTYYLSIQLESGSFVQPVLRR